MSRTAGPIAVRITDGGALAAAGRYSLTWRRVPALVLGAVLACIAALALATLPTPPAPSTHPARHGLAGLPITLAPAASASIGASDRSFWPVRHGAALLTRGGGIHSTFTASGADLRVAQGTLGLSLAAVGHDHSVEPVPAVTPTKAANQVLYRRGSVSEFYRNGPYGLEQGFSVLKRPQAGAGSLVLALRIGGSLIPEQVGSQILFRKHAGATALRYGQLSAFDAMGRRLPAHMRFRSGTIQLRIDDSHARYPLRIDPFVQPSAELTSGGQVGYGEGERSVALSSDGNTALVGAPSSNKEVGAAWVFTRSGSTWTEQTKLTGGGEVGTGRFGDSVALSSDGNTALIGGASDHESAGAAWVFSRSGSTWAQQEKLTGGEGGYGHFGSAVALSADGSTALIGGWGDNGQVGAAWVFTRSGSTWTQQGSKLTGSGETGEGRFGESVALSSDGNTALIGGPFDDGRVGAAWVFTRSGLTWTEQSKLTGGGEVGTGLFGKSVALSSDGNTALIGGASDHESAGAAWVFTRSGSTWTQQGEKLMGSGEIGGCCGGSFGDSVALSSDGSTALIGGDHDNISVGAAWVFTRSGLTWTQQGEKLTGSGERGHGYFGTSVALSSDGSTALIGSSGGEKELGAAWVFTRSGSIWTQQASKLTGGDNEEGNVEGFRAGSGVALSSDGNTALIGASGHNGDIGAVWVFTRSGTTWTEQAMLTGGGEVGEGNFGSSAALSSDGSTALIGGSGDNGGVGAVWVFTRSGSTWTQQGSKLTGGGEVGKAQVGNGVFGGSITLSSDGNTALIGGPGDADGIGAVWVFTRSGPTWTQQGEKLTGGGEAGRGSFGASVKLSSDGSTALIGAPGNAPDECRIGAVWVFTRSGSTWTQQAELASRGPCNPQGGPDNRSSFGWSVALSSDGNTALIGEVKESYGSPEDYVFTRSGSTWSMQAAFGTFYGNSVALSSDGNKALISRRGESALVFTRSGSAWTREGSPLEGFGRSVALSADGDTALIGEAGVARVFVSPPPTVVTGAASSVTQTSATLNATVDRKGDRVSDCHFEYGTTESYGSSVPCESLPGVSGPVTQVAAGFAHSLAVTSTGQLYGFGDNINGQLGSTTNNGTLDETDATPNPVLVSLPGASGPVTQVAAGVSHSLAVTSTGQLYAFGYNNYGQLGSVTNSASDNPNPALVSLPGASGPVTRVAAGEAHSLAVTSTGQLYAFGWNLYGQLGSTTNSGTLEANPTPTLVSLPGASGPVTQVAAGFAHSLAVTSTGQLYAFGWNDDGQLGSATNNGTYKANPTPTLVSLPGASGPVTQVAAGEDHSLAVTSTGQLYAFGYNRYGQLGSATNNGTEEPNPTPALVSLPGASGPVTRVAAGDGDSLALTSTGQLYAFGGNSSGQLGRATNNEEANPTPALVSLPGASGPVSQIAAGSYHTLAVTSTGQLYAFGYDGYGQLGSETNSVPRDNANPTPTLVASPEFGEGPLPVSALVGSLSAGTTYHFRIVATSRSGTSYGSDQTLVTPPSRRRRSKAQAVRGRCRVRGCWAPRNTKRRRCPMPNWRAHP
jgi:YD repeat-containing protein